MGADRAANRIGYRGGTRALPASASSANFARPSNFARPATSPGQQSAAEDGRSGESRFRRPVCEAGRRRTRTGPAPCSGSSGGSMRMTTRLHTTGTKSAPPSARTKVLNVRKGAIRPPARRGLGHQKAVPAAPVLTLDAKPAVSSRKPQFLSKTLTGRGNGPNLKKERCLKPPPDFRNGRPQRKGPS